MGVWEKKARQEARVNVSGYRGMTNISHGLLHRNVRNYFHLDNIHFVVDFATQPPEWSSIRTFIVNAKVMVVNNSVAQFAIAKGDLLWARICSDYARHCWCQLPQIYEWRENCGKSSEESLTLVIWGILEPQLPSVDLPYAADDVSGKLKNDLDAVIVEELKVDRMYEEHALFKVKRLSSAEMQPTQRNMRILAT
jgi:hypothetical protein